MKNNDILKVFVDTREQKFVKKTKVFFKSKNIDVEDKPLNDYGDVSILLSNNCWLSVERKSFPDFVTSYISNHLQDQCLRMDKSDYSCVIVHGSINDLRFVYDKYPALKRIRQPSIDKMVRNIQINYRTPIFFVENETKYFLEIMNIAETICEKGGSFVRSKKKSHIKNRPDLEIIMSINRIGEKTALALLKKFKTPENIFNASRNDLLEVNGVGDSIIADIKEWRKIYYEGV